MPVQDDSLQPTTSTTLASAVKACKPPAQEGVPSQLLATEVEWFGIVVSPVLTELLLVLTNFPTCSSSLQLFIFSLEELSSQSPKLFPGSQ